MTCHQNLGPGHHRLQEISLDLYRQLKPDSLNDRARDLEVRGSNPGPGSNFSLGIKYVCM